MTFTPRHQMTNTTEYLKFVCNPHALGICILNVHLKFVLTQPFTWSLYSLWLGPYLTIDWSNFIETKTNGFLVLWFADLYPLDDFGHFLTKLWTFWVKPPYKNFQSSIVLSSHISDFGVICRIVQQSFWLARLRVVNRFGQSNLDHEKSANRIDSRIGSLARFDCAPTQNLYQIDNTSTSFLYWMLVKISFRFERFEKHVQVAIRVKMNRFYWTKLQN